MLERIKRASLVLAVAALATVMTAVPPVSAAINDTATSERQRYFKEAAQEFGVPEPVLLGVAYNQSRWENHDGNPSASGGFGLMQLQGSIALTDGRGDPSRPLPAAQTQPGAFSVERAAALIEAPAPDVRRDDRQNIRGAAALMAAYAKETTGGKLPTSIGGWYGTVAHVSGIADPSKAADFAEDVYAAIRAGASLRTTDGQTMSLAPQAAEPDKTTLQLPAAPFAKHTAGTPKPECPATISCRFIPARHAQNDPNNATDYGNIDPANRPTDMKVKYIVIHDTEGSYESSIAWFQDPRSYVAAHYVIRSTDGEVTQMVQNKDVGWHAGNWYMNMHSIGIEHEGYAAEGATWYTEAMYRSSAKLVRYLADKYDIPLDREHIIGHEQYHGLTPARAKLMHNDPGPFWDWGHYMELLKAKPIRTDGHRSNAVTIAPRFAANQQVVRNCTAEGCANLPKQATNFVYLRTQPSANAPLLSDAGLHPDGAPGTNEIDDWSAVATYGQRFAIADRKGSWTAVWFGGQKGWFYNPSTASGRTAVNTKARLVTPKAGKASVPLYGRPVPEAAAYRDGVPPVTATPLQYSLLAGQHYVAYDRNATNDYFHVLTFDSSTPGEGEIIVGNETYIPVSYNHRQAFVKASDVDVSRH